MPPSLQKGDRINGYRIVDIFDPGAMSQSAKAISPSGETVFFKQYKLPTVRSAWYQNFVNYQKEMKRRIEGSAAKDFCYRFLDFFESRDSGIRAYYQVFEFISGGKDLAGKLSDGTMTWRQRVVFAKTFMNAMRILHDIDIIHSDLKPENLYLLPAENRNGYILKVIDMDYSILSDRKAPWDGFEGYVGTPRYFSPEHLKGQIPLEASDIFTCGIILYELLVRSGHPYVFSENDAYSEATLKYKAPYPELIDTFGDSHHDDAVSFTLYKMLSPLPEERPTAEYVHKILLGNDLPDVIPPRPKRASIVLPKEFHSDEAAIPKATEEPSSSKVKIPQLKVPVLTITSERTGISIRIPSGTEVGSGMLSRLGERFSEYYSGTQFTVTLEDGVWQLQHSNKAKNKTVVNGSVVEDTIILHDGDTLAVGNVDASVTKLPIRISISEITR